MIAIRDGGLAIYGGIIGAFLFGGLSCKRRACRCCPCSTLPLWAFSSGRAAAAGAIFSIRRPLAATPPCRGEYSEATRAYLMSSTVTAQKGVVIDPNLPVHPTFLYESIWCFGGLSSCCSVTSKSGKFNGDIALRYMIWYGARPFLDRGSPHGQSDAGALHWSAGIPAGGRYRCGSRCGCGNLTSPTSSGKDKPLMVKLAMTADNEACSQQAEQRKRPCYRSDDGCRY